MAVPTTSSVPLSKEDFIFDYGNVSIKVNLGGQQGLIMGKVSSIAMALASPVWKKFIYPPFPQVKSNGISGTTGDVGMDRDAMTAEDAEANGEPALKRQKQSEQSMPVEELDFTDDNTDTLLLLLRIAHMKFKKVPTSLSYDRLVNLAILCDQYDCVDLVRPWIQSWCANEETESIQPGHEKWLLIAWVFGREKTFESMAMDMVKDISIDADGKAQPGTVENIILPIPQSLTKSILRVRLATIEKLIQVLYTRVNRYEMTTEEFCKGILHAKLCDALSYGLLLKGLQTFSLWPKPKAEEVLVSVNELDRTIKRLQIFSIQNHSKCFGIEEMRGCVTDVVSSIKSPLLDSHRRHLQLQNDEGH